MPDHIDDCRQAAFAAEREKMADRTGRELHQAVEKVMIASAEIVNLCNFERLFREMRKRHERNTP